MPQREPLLTEAFFRDEIAYVEETIEGRLTKLRERPELIKKPALTLRANAREGLQLLFLAYSAGDDVAAIGKRLPPAIDALQAYLRHPGGKALDIDDLDDYLTALWFVSFALVFRLDDAAFLRLVGLLGNGGRDALFDRMVAARLPGRPVAKRLLRPAAFGPLLAVFDAAAPERVALLAAYLRGWYGHLREAYWHDAHKADGGGGFFGYWAVEAAGVCAVVDVDRAALAQLKYFPKDLVTQ
jgi:hypothetical protein